MGPRVVLDTNVLVSALGWRGAPYQIFQLCVTGRVSLLASPELLAELERVLSYPKFQFAADTISSYLELVMELAVIVRPTFRVSVVEADDSDNRILECALAGDAEVIVSGDSHLLDLKNFEGIPILPPRSFLDRFSPS